MANVEARGVGIQAGTTRVSGVSLDSAVQADSHRIELSGLRLAALGGSFTGSAALQELAQFRLAGNLRNLDIAQLAKVFVSGGIGYDGIVNGPVQADGDVRDFGTLAAKATLAIAPAPRGIPVSGHLGVSYNARTGSVDLDRSRIALPHTTAEFSGSLGKQIQIRVVSRNFADLQPIAAIPVTFGAGGAATIDATVRGSLAAPQVAGQVSATNFAVDGRNFTRFAAAVSASQSSASVANAVLSRGSLEARFAATAGMHKWKPENYDSLKADLVIRNADLRDVLALAGQSGFPATGALQAEAHINGTVGSPAGSAAVNVVNGTLEGEAFDSLNARADLTQTAIDVPSFSLVAGPSRINATANYKHAVNDLQRGTLTAHTDSNQVELARFQSLVKDRPGLRGLLNLNADVTAAISPSPAGTEFQVTALNANAAARGLQMEGKPLGDFTVTASTAGAAIHYNVDSNFAGSTIRVSGQSLLAGDHETTREREHRQPATRPRTGSGRAARRTRQRHAHRQCAAQRHAAETSRQRHADHRQRFRVQ